MLIEAAAAATNTTTVPWWGVPVVAGSFALGGALLTLIFNYLRDRRQHEARWEKELRTQCSAFSSAIDDLVREDEAKPELWQAMRRTYTELTYIAPEPVVEAALATFAKAQTLHGFRQVGSMVHKEDVDQVYTAEARFTNEVRKALGVKPLPWQEEG